MILVFGLLPLLFAESPRSAPSAPAGIVVTDEDRERVEAWLVIEEFENRDAERLLPATNEDFVELAAAYDRLSKHDAALYAIGQASEKWLAANGLIARKLEYWRRVNSPYQVDDSAGGSIQEERKRQRRLADEFMFLQRCIDLGYGDRATMMLRKASFLCKTSVNGSRARLPNRPYRRVIDRPRFEQAFAVAKRALELKPGLAEQFGVFEGFGGSGPFAFPMLEEEDRFVGIVERASERHARARASESWTIDRKTSGPE